MFPAFLIFLSFSLFWLSEYAQPTVEFCELTRYSYSCVSMDNYNGARKIAVTINALRTEESECTRVLIGLAMIFVWEKIGLNRASGRCTPINVVAVW